jgi:hypothetical protein
MGDFFTLVPLVIPEKKAGPSAVHHKETKSRRKHTRLAPLSGCVFNAECVFLGFAAQWETFFSGINSGRVVGGQTCSIPGMDWV